MEIGRLTRRVTVRDQSDAGNVLHLARQAAESARFDATLRGRASIVAAEMASNVLKHSTTGGEILINALVPPAGVGIIEVVSTDRGPGMSNPAAAMEDGYSTAGSRGSGLGAIRRQSSYFEIHSVAGRGTAVLARIAANGARSWHPNFDIGAVSVPKDGADVSGDGWAVAKLPTGIQLVVIDGLGHGLLAADAANLAIKTYQTAAGRQPIEVLQALHEPLRATRGATVGVATLDADGRVVTFAGVGNIGAALVTPSRHRWLVSLNGTIGREPVRFRQFETEWDPDAVLVAHSDGLTTRWRLDQPGLAAKDPTLVAAVLFRDFARQLDDVTVVVIKQRKAGPKVADR